MLTKDSKTAAGSVINTLRNSAAIGAKTGSGIMNAGLDMTASITDGITGTQTASQLHNQAKQIPDALFAPFKKSSSHQR